MSGVVGYAMISTREQNPQAQQAELEAAMIDHALAAGVPGPSWQTYSAGEGLKGSCYYSWTLISIDPEPEPTGAKDKAPGVRAAPARTP